MTCVCYAVVGCSMGVQQSQEWSRKSMLGTYAVQALGQGRGGGIGLILLVFVFLVASFTFTPWTARVVGVRMSSSAWADAVTSSSVALDQTAGGETSKEQVMFNGAVVFSFSVKGWSVEGRYDV